MAFFRFNPTKILFELHLFSYMKSCYFIAKLEHLRQKKNLVVF